MPSRWFVVQTNPGMEKFAAHNLEDQEFRVFFPRVIQKITRKKSVEIVERPLYAGYLFVRFNPKRAKWRSINGTRGVYRLLGSTDQSVCPLPKGFVEKLKRSSKRGIITLEKTEQIVHSFLPGQKVQIKAGALAGQTAVYQKALKNQALIMLTLLGRPVETTIASCLLLPQS
jgi:transcriptional antiterminator RfaH